MNQLIMGNILLFVSLSFLSIHGMDKIVIETYQLRKIDNRFFSIQYLITNPEKAVIVRTIEDIKKKDERPQVIVSLHAHNKEIAKKVIHELFGWDNNIEKQYSLITKNLELFPGETKFVKIYVDPEEDYGSTIRFHINDEIIELGIPYPPID